ncbi:hypothetical protein D3C78_922560 [compost metagenome]
MGGRQEDIFFNHIIGIADSDVVREFGGYKNAFSISQSPCGFVEDATFTAYDRIKKCKGIFILYDMVVFAHHTEYGIVVRADVGEIIGNLDFRVLNDDTVCNLNDARTFCK